MNVFTQIEAANYVATDAQIKTLAGIAVDGSRTGGTYLRILVACTQAELRPASGKRKRAQSAETTMAAFERTHTRLYAIVVDTVAVADDALESNRRTTFARSAASTLRTWLQRGGDIATLTPATVTKGSLRPPKDKAASATAAVERATSTLTDRLAVVADETREATLDALQALIDEYRPRVVAAALTRTRSRGTQPAAH